MNSPRGQYRRWSRYYVTFFDNDGRPYRFWTSPRMERSEAERCAKALKRNANFWTVEEITWN